MFPICFSGQAETVVAAYNAQAQDQENSDFWNTDTAAPAKKQAKDHYITEQNRRCCYCNHEITSANNYLWDLDHIISKKTCPEFLFEPRNLAVSCRDCNQIKLDQETRLNPTRKSFPPASKDYRIVHPHFDKYEEHIRWYGPVVVAITADKGAETIKMCNLLRYSSERLGGRSKVNDRRFDDLVGQLHCATCKQDAEVVLDLLRTVLNHVKFEGS